MKQVKSVSKKIAWLILSAALITTVACQKSSSSRKATTPKGSSVGVATGCTGCFSTGGFLATTDSEKINGAVYLGLDFYGANTSGANFNDPKIPVHYVGPVQAKGIMQVNSIDSMICNLPVGKYVLNTKIPGTWNTGVVSGSFSGPGPSGMKLEGVGQGIRFILSVDTAVIYNNTSAQGTNKLEVNRLGGNFVVESVNNQVCTLGGTVVLY